MGWTGWSEKLAGTTQHPLATVVFKDKMHVFGIGVNDKTVWVKSSADGENWGDWANFEKQTDAPVTPVVFDDVLFVFAKELDDKISVRSKARTGGWSEWKPFNGTSKTALGAAVFHGVLYVFKTRSNNEVDFRFRAKGGAWTDWKPFGAQSDVPVTPVKFDNRLYVFGKGMDDQVYQRSRGETGDWNVWQPLGATTNGAIAATVFAGDLHIFATGLNDQHIYSMMVGRNNHWSNWYPVTPVNVKTPSALAAETFKDRLHLFMRNSNSTILTQRMVVYDLPFEPDGQWHSGGNWDTRGHGKKLDLPVKVVVTVLGEQSFDYDFSHPVGANIHAVRGGQVIFLENHEGQANPGGGAPSHPDDYEPWGTCIHIRHPDGSASAYMHLKFNSIKPGVVCGANVAKGQILALSGHTGHSGNPHLHFGLQSFATFPGDCTSKPSQPSHVIKKGPHIPVYFKARGGEPYRPPRGDTR